MNRVDIEDVDPADAGGATRRGLTGPLDATGLACNHYRVPPGGGFPGGLHAHPDQAEMFVVLAGEATFERYVPADDGAAGTGGAESGEFTVCAGGAVRFAPGEFQSGRNEGGGELVALALGAPRETGGTLIPVPCPSRDGRPLRLGTGDGSALVCPDCGAEHTPAPCPDCGNERLEATLDGDGRPVAVCRDCGAAFDRPPVVDPDPDPTPDPDSNPSPGSE